MISAEVRQKLIDAAERAIDALMDGTYPGDDVSATMVVVGDIVRADERSKIVAYLQKEAARQAPYSNPAAGALESAADDIERGVP